jgi:hypothetical protein
MSNFPIVNINGDSVETLLAQHHAVYKQALLLKEALSKASPHGRNYQTVEWSRYAKARDEWLYLNNLADEIKVWADTTLNDLMRQAHGRMSSQKVGEIALRVMK